MGELSKIYGDRYYMDFATGTVYEVIRNRTAVPVALITCSFGEVSVNVVGEIPAIVINEACKCAKRYAKTWEKINANSKLCRV